jgi:hypothetical protein
MDEIIERLKTDLYKYVNNTTEALLIQNILIGILVLLYVHNTDPISIIEIITSIVSSLYLADLASGLFHIFTDICYSDTNENIINLIKLTEIHHKDPKKILDLKIIEHMETATFTPIPFLLIIYNLTPFSSKKQLLSHIIFMYSSQMSQITHFLTHKMNHSTYEERNTIPMKFIKILQENHIIIHPEEHRKHHLSPNKDINFCILNGWANPLINSVIEVPCVKSVFRDAQTKRDKCMKNIDKK